MGIEERTIRIKMNFDKKVIAFSFLRTMSLQMDLNLIMLFILLQKKIEPYETEKYNVEISLLQQEARLGMLHTIISRYRMIILILSYGIC